MKPTLVPRKPVLRPRQTPASIRPLPTLAFARAVAQRYGRLDANARRLDLLLARRERQDVSLVYRQGDRISNILSWTGRFFLRAEASAASTKALAGRPVTGMPNLYLAGQRAIAPSTVRTAAKTVVITALADRIASRRLRIESGEGLHAGARTNPANAASAMSVSALAKPESRAVDLPVASARRNSPLVDSQESPVKDEIVLRGDTRQVRGADARKTAAPLADHEVERIADRVMGSLDRRIVSQRERMGRI